MRLISPIIQSAHRESRSDCLQLEEDPPALLRTDLLQLLAGHAQQHGAAQGPQAPHRTEHRAQQTLAHFNGGALATPMGCTVVTRGIIEEDHHSITRHRPYPSSTSLAIF